MKKETLLDVKKLEELIDGLDLGDEDKKRIKVQWLKYVIWWDSRSTTAKRKYQWLRGAVVVASALIPALIGLRELKIWGEYDSIFALAAILVSLVVAICGGLEGFFQFWRHLEGKACCR